MAYYVTNYLKTLRMRNLKFNNKKPACAACKKERDCDLRLKRSYVFVKLLQKIKKPIIVLPTDYPTTTEADICFGVGLGILSVKVKNGDLYVGLPMNNTNKKFNTYETLRKQYTCKTHHTKNNVGNGKTE